MRRVPRAAAPRPRCSPWREGGALGAALGFYLMVVAILPLGLGPDLNLLSRIAPGVLWVALLLAALLSLGAPVRDRRRGRIAGGAGHGTAAARARGRGQGLAHWLTTGLPLSLLAPLLGLLLNLELAAYPALLATLHRRHAGHQLHRRHRAPR